MKLARFQNYFERLFSSLNFIYKQHWSLPEYKLLPAPHKLVKATLRGSRDLVCRFDIYSQYLGGQSIQVFTFHLRNKNWQLCKNTLLSKMFRIKNNFSDANFFLLHVSCEKNLTPFQRLLGSSLPVPQQKQLTLPVYKTKNKNRGKDTGTQFLHLKRHLGDTGKSASTATAAHSVPQSTTAQQCCPCHGGLLLSPRDLPSLKCLWFIFIQNCTKWIQTAMWLMLF